MKKKKLLDRILSGSNDNNIKFSELENLLLSLGFQEKIRGSHHIFYKDKIDEIINLQPLQDGKAKRYQIKQVRGIIIKYKLHQEE